MGCWNGTCMISNLPIIEGDKVVAIVLKKNGIVEQNKLNGYVYPTDELKPIGIFEGEYNDYGSIKNISDNYNCFEHIKDMNFDITKDNLCKNDNTLESFFTCIERGLCNINNERVCFVLIHLDLFDKLIKTEKDYNNDYLYFIEFGMSPSKKILEDNKFMNGLKILYKFWRVLMNGRIIYHETCGAGSQNDNLTIQKHIAKYVTKHKISYE